MLWLKNLDLFTIVQFYYPNPMNLGLWQVSYLFFIIVLIKIEFGKIETILYFNFHIYLS